MNLSALRSLLSDFIFKKYIPFAKEFISKTFTKDSFNGSNCLTNTCLPIELTISTLNFPSMFISINCSSGRNNKFSGFSASREKNQISTKKVE